MADGYIESRMAEHMAGRGPKRTATMTGIRKGVAAALSALSLVSVTTFAQGRVVEVQSPSMRIYVPSKPSGMALVVCPGGGYSHVAKEHEGYDWAPFFNSLGVTYAVLDYALPKGDRSIPMNDVAAAFRVLSENAEEWHADPARTGIMGFSAGGHLASTMANGAVDGCRPAFQILFYPVVSLKPEITHTGTATQFLGQDDTPELRERYSAELQASQATPPALLLLSADDQVVDPMNSINYFLAMRKQGVDASLHIYPSGGHGWGYRREQMAFHDALMVELAAWIRKQQEQR